MKKLVILAALCAMALPGIAQKIWTTDLNEIVEPDSPKLGTLNSRPLQFYTSGIKQMTLTPDGELQLRSLSIPNYDYDRFVTVDQEGNFRAIGPGDPSVLCSPIQAPWVLGGNPNATSSANLIGTCNNVDFILKASNRPLMFMKSSLSSWGSGLVGFGLGNTNPLSQVDITDGVPDATWSRSAEDHTRIYGDYFGTIQATGRMNLLFADEFTLGTGTRGAVTPFIHVQSAGRVGIGTGSPLSKLHVSGGNFQVDGRIGVNTSSPTVTIDARDGSAAEIRAYTTSANTAKLTAMNGLLSYSLSIDATGMGHIGAGSSNIINFKMDGSPAYPQVWIGQRPTTGTHATYFNFAAPKIVAKEIYVFTTGTWADYVFESDYQLPQLSEVEAYYKKNKHLPEIPSALEVQEEGVNIGEMNILLLKKIEELTLYVVEQQKEINTLKEKVK